MFGAAWRNNWGIPPPNPPDLPISGGGVAAILGGIPQYLVQRVAIIGEFLPNWAVICLGGRRGCGGCGGIPQLSGQRDAIIEESLPN